MEEREENRGQDPHNGRELSDPKNKHPFDKSRLKLGQTALKTLLDDFNRAIFRALLDLSEKTHQSLRGGFAELFLKDCGDRDDGHESSVAGAIIKVKGTERNGEKQKVTESYGKLRKTAVTFRCLLCFPLLSQDELENAQKSADLAGPKNKHPFQEFGLGLDQFGLQIGQVGLGGQRLFQAPIIGFNSLFHRLGDFCRLLFVENGAEDFKNLESIGVGHSYSLAGGVMKVKGTESYGEKQKETESYGKQPLLSAASFAFRYFPSLSFAFRFFVISS